MELSAEDFSFINKNKSKIPWKVLAEKYNMSVLQFIKILREKGISKVVRREEYPYIEDNISIIPAEVIRETLGMSKTQFQQILGRRKYKVINL